MVIKIFNDDQDTYIEQKFSQHNFTDNELHENEFDNCEFDGCNFSNTTFSNCKFYECKFTNCNLSMITVKGSSFHDVLFEETKAIGVNWTQAAWPKIKLHSPFKFYKCILNNSSFFGLCIKEIELVECKSKEVDFREADCSEADFAYTDLSGSLFGRTNLTKANFCEAMNYNIDIFENTITKAKFSLPDAIGLLQCLDIELEH